MYIADSYRQNVQKAQGNFKGETEKKMDNLKINQFNKPSALRQKSITIRLCFLSFFVLLISVWIWVHSNLAGKAIPSGISSLPRNIWMKSIRNSSRTHIFKWFPVMFCTLQSLDIVCTSQPFQMVLSKHRGQSNQCLTGGGLNITTCPDGKGKKGEKVIFSSRLEFWIVQGYHQEYM